MSTTFVRLLVVFVALNWSWFSVETTRFLPMIVWDHRNPLLSCKCNWLTFSSIDEFDVVDFVCPSYKVTVSLLDAPRGTETMNENIFRRKWTGSNLDELRESLSNGSFCDPLHNDTKKLGSCKDGKEGQALLVKFQPNKNYVQGDIVVFFNNGKDGLQQTLQSTAKQCSSVFIVNMTLGVKKHHDFSYGKCLNTLANSCEDINTKCDITCRSMPSPPPTAPTTTMTTTTTTTIQTTTLLESTKNSTETISSYTPEYYQRTSACCDTFNLKYFGIGLIAGVGLCCIIFVIFFLAMRLKGQNDRRQGTRRCGASCF